MTEKSSEIVFCPSPTTYRSSKFPIKNIELIRVDVLANILYVSMCLTIAKLFTVSQEAKQKTIKQRIQNRVEHSSRFCTT